MELLHSFGSDAHLTLASWGSEPAESLEDVWDGSDRSSRCFDQDFARQEKSEPFAGEIIAFVPQACLFGDCSSLFMGKER